MVRAKTLMHGKTSPIHHDGKGVFAGLPDGFTATRYHSLSVRRESLPARAGGHRLDRRRRDHGLAAPHPADARRAVPPRIHRHRGRPRAARPTSSTWPASSAAAPGLSRPMSDAFKPLLARLADGATLIGGRRRRPSSPPACAASRRRPRSPPPSPPCACAARPSARSPPAPGPCAAPALMLEHPLRGDRRLRHRRRRRCTPSTSPPPSAFVAAGAGLKVAKHGNRAMSSKSGSSDVLDARWASISPRRPSSSAARWTRPASASCSRPAHHGAMRHVMPIAPGAGLPHHLQPAGPAVPTRPGAQRQVLGVFDCPLGRAAGAGAGRAGRGARLGGARRRPGRDDHHRRRPRSPSGATAACACSTSRPRPSACRAPRLADLRGGDPAHNAQALARPAGRRRRAPIATSCC